MNKVKLGAFGLECAVEHRPPMVTLHVYDPVYIPVPVAYSVPVEELRNFLTDLISGIEVET